MMTASDMLVKTIDAMVIMNAAIKNMRLYPSTSDMIINAIDRVFRSFEEILNEGGAILFAESERSLLISGQSLNESDQKKPQVEAFLELMLNFGIKSLEFKEGIDSDEVKVLLEVLSRKPEDIDTQGGLKEVMEKENLSHIILDQKVYVAVDKDQQILTGTGIKDEDIIKYLSGDETASDIDLDQAREMAKDSDWVAKIFQSGINNIKNGGKGGKGGDKDLSDLLLEMISAIDNISDKSGKDAISRNIATSIVAMEDSMISSLLVKNLEGLLGGGLLDHIINQLDDKKFERLAIKLKHMGGKISSLDDPEIKPVDRAYTLLMTSKKGNQLKEKIDNKIALEKTRAKKEMAQLKTGLSKILKGETEPFLDKHLMEQLPAAIKQLFANKNNKAATSIIEQTGQALLNEKAEIRTAVSQALTTIFDNLDAMDQLDEMLDLSHLVIRWIKTDARITSAGSQLFTNLGNLSSKLIHKSRFSDSNHILETFNLISSVKLKRSAVIQDLTFNLTEKIADEDTIKLLLKKFDTDVEATNKQIIYSLAMLGEAALKRLLKVLKVSQDTYERGHIIKIISKIGHLESSILVEEIKQDGPWYYMRNLLLLLGNVGTEEHIPVLKPFLTHKDFRLQKVAVNSILKIEGRLGNEILLAALPTLNDRLKLDIISKFGQLKLKSAVNPLIKLLKSKAWESPDLKAELDEKICIALGLIGSSEAIPVLTEVAEQKKLLQRSVYGESVKEAASKALTALTMNDG